MYFLKIKIGRISWELRSVKDGHPCFVLCILSRGDKGSRVLEHTDLVVTSAVTWKAQIRCIQYVASSSVLDGQTRQITNKPLHVDVEGTRHTPKNNNNNNNNK